MSDENRSVPVGLCECGCGQQTTISKRTGKHNRYVHAGHANRAWPGYDVTDSGCWQWRGPVDKLGYARVYHPTKKRAYLAHRFYYEQAHGEIGAPSLDHLCRNPSCVNPDHLEPVTNQENVRRGKRAKLTWEDVREIRASPLTNTEIARKFGVSAPNVCNIRKGRAWPESQDPERA